VDEARGGAKSTWPKGHKVMSRGAKVFELKREGLNVPRALFVVGVLLVPVIVLGVIDQEKYLPSVVSGALSVGRSDSGGDYGHRAQRMAAIAGIGAC
jgi:hypothetical protein